MNNYEGRTRGCLRQPWIASPRFNGTYRKCSGGFAKTGRGKPCPRALRDVLRARRGRVHSPLGRGGAKRRGGSPRRARTQPTSYPPKPPSLEGGASAEAGGAELHNPNNPGEASLAPT
ncbi:MAG: hypothetical protein LBM98_00205 [Oscillospiraceae bacterium]|nr:hypothetical protein [Oscillospiraceae bacterium]